MKTAILCLMAVLTAAAPCFADIVPTQYDRKSTKDSSAVQARLESLGASPSAAENRVRLLSSADVAFFAAHPERVQSAGGLYWYEWVGGALTLGILTVLYFTVTGD